MPREIFEFSKLQECIFGDFYEEFSENVHQATRQKSQLYATTPRNPTLVSLYAKDLQVCLWLKTYLYVLTFSQNLMYNNLKIFPESSPQLNHFFKTKHVY